MGTGGEPVTYLGKINLGS